LVLAPASSSADDEIATGALQGLGLMGDPRAVPYLLRALETGEGKPDTRRAEVAAGAMQILTGHYEDLEPRNLARRWATWWDANHHRMPGGVRHRYGKVFDMSALIDAMERDDAWLRRTAYDELVISTGERLPFDTDGPWRIQLHHVQAWRAWWATHKARFVAGRWYLDGKGVD
jgi:hypothetical protein